MCVHIHIYTWTIFFFDSFKFVEHMLKGSKPVYSLWFPAAAAAAKSFQSCPTLCDSIDGSPPGSPVPGVLQARILEWVAISFSNGSLEDSKLLLMRNSLFVCLFFPLWLRLCFFVCFPLWLRFCLFLCK